jgi:23S rRNA (adenine2030-N6)-methyltransferase
LNYRHVFHAGNFGDCVKHALLVWLVKSLARKPAPVVVLDTHAGRGRYDLDSNPARRTGEWLEGIGQLLERPPAALGDYVGLVHTLGLYPGSPALIRALLRTRDRLVCCELHPEDYAALRRLFAHDSQVAVHHRDGWEALRALLPPRARRGLVLIDPPFEQTDEFERLAAGLRKAHERFATGVFAAWYPIKHRAPVRAFHVGMKESGLHDIVAAELLMREPIEPTRLNGCGLLVINPPWRFEAEVPAILDALSERLGGSGYELTRLADE